MSNSEIVIRFLVSLVFLVNASVSWRNGYECPEGYVYTCVSPQQVRNFHLKQRQAGFERDLPSILQTFRPSHAKWPTGLLEMDDLLAESEEDTSPLPDSFPCHLVANDELRRLYFNDPLYENVKYWIIEHKDEIGAKDEKYCGAIIDYFIKSYARHVQIEKLRQNLLIERLNRLYCEECGYSCSIRSLSCHNILSSSLYGH